ncbi:unnamed protein product [marine sediment metagenome]|uniref:Uncharacterized protein n=1 Tax=marine sediment metagenome TaxID=412755 RepID=X1PUN7_9ZZZZ
MYIYAHLRTFGADLVYIMVDLKDKRSEIVERIENVDKEILKIRDDCESAVALLEKKSADLKDDLFVAHQEWIKKHSKSDMKVGKEPFEDKNQNVE